MKKYKLFINQFCKGYFPANFIQPFAMVIHHMMPPSI